MTLRAPWQIFLAIPLAIGIGALIPLFTTPGVQQSALIVAIAAVLAVPLMVRAINRQFDPFEPIVFFIAVWGLMFVARPLVMRATGDYGLRDRYNIEEGVTGALVVGLVGAIAFVAGYFWALRRRSMPRKQSVLREAPPAWAVAALAIIGFGAIAALWGTTVTDASSAGSGAYTYLAPLLTIPVVVLVLRRGHTKLAYALLAVSAVGLLTLGQRAFVIWPITAVFIYQFMARRARPRVATIAAVAVFGFLPLSTVLENAREKEVTPSAALSESDTRDAGAAVQQFAEGDTTAMFSALSLQMMTEGSTWRQRPGYWLLSTPTRWIPGALWSGKPLGSGEYLYTLYFPEHYRTNKAGTAFTLASEFYFDLGMLGVVLGMAGIGYLCGVLWLWVKGRPDDPWTWALYAPVFGLAIVVFRGDVGLGAGLALFVFAPLIITYLLARRSVSEGNSTG